MNQDSLLPTNKVAAVGLTGALTIVLVYVLSLLHVNLPPEVSAALTMIISTGAGYLIKERAPKV